MILVVFGTTGELIKLAPVLLQLEQRGHTYVLATTAQQVQQIPLFLEQFGLRQPDVWLARGARGRDLSVNPTFPAGCRPSAAPTRASGVSSAPRFARDRAGRSCSSTATR